MTGEQAMQYLVDETDAQTRAILALILCLDRGGILDSRAVVDTLRAGVEGDSPGLRERIDRFCASIEGFQPPSLTAIDGGKEG